jgi:colanic acid/amylovoran biosynthesis protein
MRVFLNCVYKNNLGDDLFVYEICRRYPDTIFDVINYRGASLKNKPNNLKDHRYGFRLYDFIRKIGRLFRRRNIIDSYYIKKSDIVVTLGGSMFTELKNRKRQKIFDWYSGLNKDLYILGSNIGPIYTAQYLDSLRRVIFSNAKSISLRDKESLKLADSPVASYAPDIIWGCERSAESRIKKQAIVSIINCSKKASQMRSFNANKYRECIVSTINTLQKNGYKVVLYSFCKEEGDEEEIKAINERLDSKAGIYCYNGNIEEALNLVGESEVVIGSRFHANILGFLFEKKVVPIIYNDKTRNLLKDLDFKGKYIDIENDIYPDVKELLNNKPLPKNRLSISEKSRNIILMLWIKY